MLMRAATVVQQLRKSCKTCFMFYCMSYFTCDRSLRAHKTHTVKSIIVVVNVVKDLSIDKVGGDLVKARVVPRSEQLLAVE